jgi:glycosyltransferase involved in cell wall biosynthesis
LTATAAASAVGSPRPRVIFFASLFAATGGGPNAMRLLAERLVARGYDVVVLTRPPLSESHRYVAHLRAHGVPVATMPYLEGGAPARMGAFVTALALTVPYAVVRRTSLPYAWEAARSIFLTRVARIERARIRRELDARLARDRTTILHVWGPAQLAPLLLEWAAEKGAPALYHEMGEADEAYVRTWQLEPTVRSLHLARVVICCSTSVAEAVRRVYGYAGPVRTIPFMIEPPRPVPERPRDTVVFGTIGRLVPHKRHQDMLHALKRVLGEVPGAHLVIAGSGPSRGELERLAEDLDLAGHVTFTGEFEDLATVMAGLDVVVVASASESQAMPLTEAMAYGKPVIATAFGGMPDFVEDGATGLLAPVGDVAALAAAMSRLASDRGLREQMGRRGHERYLAQYTPEVIVDAVEAQYRYLLAPAEAGAPR